MQPNPHVAAIADSSTWAVRGDYWHKKANPVPQYKARKRKVIHRPLVLSGHGIRMAVEYGTLRIQCGFTHYPQAREEYRFFPQDRQLPSRLVVLDGDGSISLAALEWLAVQGVPLVQISWRGHTASIGGAAYAATPRIVQRQLALTDTPEALQHAKALIVDKIRLSCATIKALSESATILQKMQAQITLLEQNPPQSLLELLTAEAIAAAAYFRHWYTFSLKWRGLSRRPIPPEWAQIGTRIGKNNSNQFALTPVNAILNYAYGVLESQVRGYVLAKGADPSLGLMHSNRNSDSPLVFDLMEPVRPVMDKHIFKLVLDHTFSHDDFVLNAQGVCRLHPQFARYVVKHIQDIPEIETITHAHLHRIFPKLIAK
jgi:CRISPR-associated endonuclease Cas1